MRCDHCIEEKKYDVRKIVLPLIGFGGPFDSIDEEEEISFKLCANCFKQINDFIYKRGVSPSKFWEFKIIVSDDFCEHFEYEDLLWEVLHKFVPQALNGRRLSITQRFEFLKARLLRNKKGGDRY